MAWKRLGEDSVPTSATDELSLTTTERESVRKVHSHTDSYVGKSGCDASSSSINDEVFIPQSAYQQRII